MPIEIESMYLEFIQDPVGKERRLPYTRGLVVRHIPLHDLEGFWWVSLVNSIRRTVQGIKHSADSKDQAKRLRGLVEEMLRDNNVRRSVMTDNDTFKDAIALLPPQLQVAGSKLEEARRVLTQAYRAAESDRTNIKSAVPEDVYSHFIGAYKAIALDLGEKGDFDLTSGTVNYVIEQDDPNRPRASLSLDSLRAQLGKRTRGDAYLDDVPGTTANDADARSMTSRSAKRMKHSGCDDECYVMPASSSLQGQQEDDGESRGCDADGGEENAVSGEVSKEA